MVDEIKKLIKDTSTENDTLNAQLFVGKVIKVNQQQQTVDVSPTNGDAEIYDVRLKAKIGSGEGIFPAIGSEIVVGLLEGSETNAVALAFSEVDDAKFKLVRSLELDSEEIVINGGLNGALIIIEKLVERIQRLENAHNSLLNQFSTHTHTHSLGPGTTSPTISTLTPINPLTIATDLENPKIKH